MLVNPNISLREFVDKQVNESKRDSMDVNSIQSTLTEIAGNPAFNISYLDNMRYGDAYDVYKQLIT
jgi:hypothetical protein